MAAIRLESVSKQFSHRLERVSAVDCVSLHVSDGELLVIVGPSGCGKSTTLRLIAGLESPTSGSVFIQDRCVNAVPPRDRDLAMVFQSHSLYPHMTVYGNMAFGLKMRRVPMTDRDRRVRETAQKIGVAHLLKRKPAALSGGERQRVAVGRAIVRRPQAFLFDEPLSNLDARTRSTMRAEIKQLHKELGATILYVTHDQEEAMTLGDRIAVMRNGQLQQCGTPQEVYSMPSNRFVGEFIGSAPMNFVEGSVRYADGEVMVESTFGTWPLPHYRPVASAIANEGRVVLGIRPEHCHVSAMGGSDARHSVAVRPSDYAQAENQRVVLVEPLGDMQLVHVCGGRARPWIAKLPSAQRIATDIDVRLAFDLSRAHLFSADEEGARL